MLLILGIALAALAVAAFLLSLPRRGRTAGFVGTHWEGYAVVLMIAALGVGMMLIASDIAQLLS